MLDDASLPEPGDLARVIVDAQGAGSAVAVHCVSAPQLIVTIAALEQVGRPGNRIEHAAVVPTGFAATLAALGVQVVTQPGFIEQRGDDYMREVERAEQHWLYPCASLIRAGVTVAAGTDAPFGPSDPWLCIAAAMTRRTPSGHIIGKDERVQAHRALRLFLADPSDLRRTRSVAPGQPADLCLLETPVSEALRKPTAAVVRATVIGGKPIV